MDVQGCYGSEKGDEIYNNDPFKALFFQITKAIQNCVKFKKHKITKNRKQKSPL